MVPDLTPTDSYRPLNFQCLQFPPLNLAERSGKHATTTPSRVIQLPQPQAKTLGGFKGPGTELSMTLRRTPQRAAIIAAVQVNEVFERCYLLNFCS
jgi:hypothetical protein